MRRSTRNDDDEWEMTGKDDLKTPTISRPRRVTLSDPWQSNSYSVPRPTQWTPEEMDQKSQRAEKTPNPIQSPPFQVRQNDEVRSLKERMDRQEALMETILEELTSLRRELKRNESVKREQETETRRASENERTELRGGVMFEGSAMGKQTPFSSTDGNRERAKGEPVRSPEATDIRSRRHLSIGSPGAKFVAEFSELFELDSGQHALLASIMDRSLSRHQGDP
jgi:hypothetical protein